MSNLFSGNFPLLTYRNLSVGTTGAVVKSAKGAIFEYYIYNNSAAVLYLKLYDKATAPTSSDTPIRTYPIPATNGANLCVTDGIQFLNGISIRCTTGVADNDTGAPAANDCVVNIGYL
jgi:hypothetical protein